jgi:AcrR family transcriptional regulator
MDTTAHSQARAGSPPRQTRARNPRGEGERLREQLIDAAEAAIASSGDTGKLTLRGVARELGIAAPSIYRHFSDVDHLKLAVVDRAFQRFVRERDLARQSITDPAEALLAGCRAYCRFATSNPGPYRFMFSHESPARGQQSPTGTVAFEALAASIQRCQESGATSLPDDPRAAAAGVWAALHGLILLRLNVPDFDWPESLEAMATHTVARLVGLTPTTGDIQKHSNREESS